jgi:hypothetical protein
MFFSFLRSAAVAALAVSATVAQADPFFDPTATVTAKLTWNWFSDGSKTVNVTGYGPNGSAGQFQGSFDPDGSSGLVAADDFFRFFCMELSQSATTASVDYTRYLGVVNGDDSAELTRLFDQFYPNRSAGNFHNPGNFGSFGGNATESAAMQLAIWNILFDNDFTLDSGSFIAYAGTNAGAVSRANQMLAAVNNPNYVLSGQWTLYRFVGSHNQDYLSATYTRPSGDNGVPLPGTLSLLGAGLAGLGFVRRKAQR